MNKNEFSKQNDKILSHKLFLQREYSIVHLEYDKEMEFYEAVKKGDFNKLKKIMVPLKNEKLGKLSTNSIRNLKYHLIITVAMITRFCIEGGMPSETAYTLSDIYIQQIDVCNDDEEIELLHNEIVFDFADRMLKIYKATRVSKTVLKAINFIYDNLQKNISLQQVAESAGLNKTYFCKLFKDEMNMTVFQYVTKVRIETAANMLEHSDYSAVAISNYFMFSSHSYFIKMFKKYMGVTPLEYKKSNYSKLKL